MTTADSKVIKALIVELSDPKGLQTWKLEERRSVGRGTNYWCLVKYSSGMYINCSTMEIMQSGKSTTVKGFWLRHKFGKVLDDAIEYLENYQKKLIEEATRRPKPGAKTPEKTTEPVRSPMSGPPQPRYPRAWMEGFEDLWGDNGGTPHSGGYVYTPPRKPQEIAEEILKTQPTAAAVPVGDPDGSE